MTDVAGTVTATRPGGFFLEDPVPDGDDATSEGIIIAVDPLAAVSPVAVGDAVTVSGIVVEARLGGRTSPHLTVTRINATDLALSADTTALPPPAIIGTAGRQPPAEIWDPDRGTDVETASVFDPGSAALDFYESLEGMRVSVADPVVVGPASDGGYEPAAHAAGRCR